MLHNSFHFNFIKMHLQTHYKSYIEQFGGRSPYLTELGKLVHKQQMKTSYQQTNKQKPQLQMVACYKRVSAMGLRIAKIEQLIKEGFFKEEKMDALRLMGFYNYMFFTSSADCSRTQFI